MSLNTKPKPSLEFFESSMVSFGVCLLVDILAVYYQGKGSGHWPMFSTL